MKPETKTTQQKLSKIAAVPYLYRHEGGQYYGKKKLRDGRIKAEVLRTENGVPVTERKLAEKFLKEWVEKVDAPPSQHITFKDFYEKFLQTRSGFKPRTKQTYYYVMYWFKKYDKRGLLEKPIEEIKTSDISILLSSLPKVPDEWSPSTYNRFSMIICMIFDLAVADGVIKDNPCNRVSKELIRKRDKRKPDEIPSIEQCEKIIDNIRNQPHSNTPEDSADKLEFLFLAGLGEAEANHLKWRDVDFEKNNINAYRIKTKTYFDVPIYPFLKPFLVNLYEKQGRPAGSENLFKIVGIVVGIYHACDRLGFPRYSPRDFRKARITYLIRKGIAPKLVAKWQGHQDGGVLIMRTYSNVIDEAAKEFEKEQLKKLQ